MNQWFMPWNNIETNATLWHRENFGIYLQSMVQDDDPGALFLTG
jgi:hypothetical protein